MLSKFLFSFKQVKVDDMINQELDVYGFTNNLVALSNQGKVFAFSSYDGQMAWSAKFGKTAVTKPEAKNNQKIFVREKFNRENENKEQQIVTISDDKLVFLDANNGGFKFSQTLESPAD